MKRFFPLIVISALASGCSLVHWGGGQGLDVVGQTEYCGTPSQASAAHYFANPGAFASWIDYRDITDLKPSMAAHGGVIVVEMGQRPTGGYQITLNRKKTNIHNGTLKISMDLSAPRLDAAVSQALIAECVALRPPKGDYSQVRVVDQLDHVRGTAQVH
jgi:hypothetical protein